jgi:hypothetical protein
MVVVQENFIKNLECNLSPIIDIPGPIASLAGWQTNVSDMLCQILHKNTPND